MYAFFQFIFLETGVILYGKDITIEEENITIEEENVRFRGPCAPSPRGYKGARKKSSHFTKIFLHKLIT